MKHLNIPLWRVRTSILAAAFTLGLVQNSNLLAQTDYQQVIHTTTSGNRVFMEINMLNLQESLDSLFLNMSSIQAGGSGSSWSDVLANGSNPGTDINFNSFGISGLGELTSTGTLTADSLVLTKDAEIAGKLSVTDVVTVGDSLKVSGYVEFADSLQVVRAVAIGETLEVTGVTSLGDSLHVAANVDFDALFNVDGAVGLGSTLFVSGKSTLNDSLRVNSGATIEGTLYAGGIEATDVITGQVSSLSNHDTDDLAEGQVNLYMTAAERSAIATMMHQIDSLSCMSIEHAGYEYELIFIGDDCWFAENLRADEYSNGDPIPTNLSGAEWSATTSGAATLYNYDPSNLDVYGRMYNWPAVVDSRGVCPSGWHVSTNDDWTNVTSFLGGIPLAAAKMKSTPPSWDGNNSSGFSALPGGASNFSNSFYFGGSIGCFWVANDAISTSSYMHTAPGTIVIQIEDSRNGLSIRCVKDR
jgi:uncharacterized protein (TIGR02145 family)